MRKRSTVALLGATLALLAAILGGCSAGPTKSRDHEGDFVLNIASAAATNRAAPAAATSGMASNAWTAPV